MCVYVCIPVCVCARRTERFLHACELASSKVKRAKKRLAILGKREGEREVEKKREKERGRKRSRKKEGERERSRKKEGEREREGETES